MKKSLLILTLVIGFVMTGLGGFMIGIRLKTTPSKKEIEITPTLLPAIRKDKPKEQEWFPTFQEFEDYYGFQATIPENMSYYGDITSYDDISKKISRLGIQYYLRPKYYHSDEAFSTHENAIYLNVTALSILPNYSPTTPIDSWFVPPQDTSDYKDKNILINGLTAFLRIITYDPKDVYYKIDIPMHDKYLLNIIYRKFSPDDVDGLKKFTDFYNSISIKK